MVARDLTTGNTTSPVRYVENDDYNKDDGSPKFLPAEPHIGLRATNDEAPEETVQTGYVRGGTSNPPEGSDGNVQQLDNDGKVTKVHPGEIALIVEREGPHAALKKLTGPETPPGDPEPSSEGSGKKGGKK